MQNGFRCFNRPRVIPTIIALFAFASGTSASVQVPHKKSSRSNANQIELLVQRGHDSRVDALAMDPSGRLLATVSGGTVKLWNLKTGDMLHTLQVNGSWNITLAISHDGNTLGVFTDGGNALMYDITSGRLLRTIANGTQPAAIAFSPDKKTLALGNHSSRITLYNYKTGRHIRSIHGHSEYMSDVSLLTFSPNGSLLASSVGTGSANPKLEI